MLAAISALLPRARYSEMPPAPAGQLGQAQPLSQSAHVPVHLGACSVSTDLVPVARFSLILLPRSGSDCLRLPSAS